MIKNHIFILVVLMLSACTNSAPELPTQAGVELDRYMGSWYEQARLPNRFQKQCVGEVKATYTLLSNTTIKVVNQCLTAQQKIVHAEAEGRLSAAVQPTSAAVLEVRFAPSWLSWLPMVWGDYWIIKIEGDYEYALVGTPNREFLWVLSRDQHAEPVVIEALLNYANQLGFRTEQIVFRD